METKKYFKIGEVSKLTGIPVYRIRLLADKNPNLVKKSRSGHRKINVALLNFLKKVKI